MAISVARIAVELGIIADDTGTVSAGLNDVLTTYLSAANLHVTAYAPDAPEAVKDMAVVRYVAYQYQERGRGRQSRNAFVSSGAEAILSEYRSARLASSGGAPSGGAPSGGAATLPEGGAVGDILTRAAAAMTGAWRGLASILAGFTGAAPGKVLKLGTGNQPEWADDETADPGSGLDAAAVGVAIRDSPLAGRVTDLEEFEASVRTNTLVFNGNVTQAASRAFQALPGVAWPARGPDREIIVRIRNSAGSLDDTVTINLSSIEIKGVASLADQASSRNSIRFSLGEPASSFSLAFGPSRAIYFAADDIDVYTLTLTDSAVRLGQRGPAGPAGPAGAPGAPGAPGAAGDSLFRLVLDRTVSWNSALDGNLTGPPPSPIDVQVDRGEAGVFFIECTWLPGGTPVKSVLKESEVRVHDFSPIPGSRSQSYRIFNPGAAPRFNSYIEFNRGEDNSSSVYAGPGVGHGGAFDVRDKLYVTLRRTGLGPWSVSVRVRILFVPSDVGDVEPSYHALMALPAYSGTRLADYRIIEPQPQALAPPTFHQDPGVFF